MPHSKADKRIGKQLTSTARRWVLQAIARYLKDEKIAEEVKKRFNIEISPYTISQNYRFNGQYKAQIQEYRDRFNKGIEEDPGMSKRYMLALVSEAIEEAKAEKDWQGMARLVKQHNDMTGHKISESVEINHNHSGGMSLEAKIKLMTGKAPAPPAALLDNLARNSIDVPAQIVERVEAKNTPQPAQIEQ